MTQASHIALAVNPPISERRSRHVLTAELFLHAASRGFGGMFVVNLDRDLACSRRMRPRHGCRRQLVKNHAERPHVRFGIDLKELPGGGYRQRLWSSILQAT